MGNPQYEAWEEGRKKEVELKRWKKEEQKHGKEVGGGDERGRAEEKENQEGGRGEGMGARGR